MNAVFGRIPAVLLAILFVPGSTLISYGQDEPFSPSRTWAVVVGVEKYQHAPHLRFTVRDAQELGRVLTTRCGVPRDNLLEITDASANTRSQPLRESLLTRIPEWLSRIPQGDAVLFYFSGHGVRDEDGRLHLAPLDCDPDNPATTGIAVEWLRQQIANCPAGFKLLIIDACHAGSEKGTAKGTGVSARDVTLAFDQLKDIVTLASSSENEQSQIWDDKEHSLFTYWLIQALKGHADSDGDSRVDVDELNRYVHRNVTRTAELRFPRKQTPVRVVRSGTPGVPLVVQNQPQPLKQVLNDMAEQLSIAMEEGQEASLGVLEFTNESPTGEFLRTGFGLLGRYCAEELERRLTDYGRGRYNVVDRRRLQRALQAEEFAIADLDSSDALAAVSYRSGGLPVIGLGTLSNRRGRVVSLRCKLAKTQSDEIVGSVGGTAVINESEWAMLGLSASVQPDDRMPPLPGTTPPQFSIADQVIEQLDRRSSKPHPMLDPKFPYPISLRVNGEIRKPVFRGNEMLVPVRQGETLHLIVDHKSDQTVLLRLLVDGLNTLPQKVVKDGEVTFEIAPRVNLNEARPWVLDPEQTRRFFIKGFVTETGVNGTLREFKIVDGADSVAAKKQFTDQLGLITAAFYAPSTSRGPGVGAGQELRENLKERGDVEVGNLLHVVQIRYVDADELPKGAGR